MFFCWTFYHIAQPPIPEPMAKKKKPEQKLEEAFQSSMENPSLDPLKKPVFDTSMLLDTKNKPAELGTKFNPDKKSRHVVDKKTFIDHKGRNKQVLRTNQQRKR